MGSHQQPRRSGLNLAELARKSAFLQGRKSAESVLVKNTVDNEQVVQAILRTAFSFSEFQQLGYFHKNAGYFETLVDFEEVMPLPSTSLSPLYGKFIAELAFAAYVSASLPHAPTPVVVSLGAGRGVLDFDLIAHLTDSSFEHPDFPMHVKTMRETSTFIVSDRTQKSLEMLTLELAPLMKDPALAGRVKVQKINALDFKLGPFPFGVVHTNELIDALPAEPVIKQDGRLYSVRLLAYEPTGPAEHCDDTAAITSSISIPGLLTAKAAREKIEAGDYNGLRFMPVFIPLEFDENLADYVSKTQVLRNIDAEACGGVYPVFIGLDGLFRSVRQSFKHGAVIVVDYVSVAQGTHNWNKTVNIFRDYRFGREDVDFQIDPQQVIDRAAASGLALESRLNVGAELRKSAQALLSTFTQSDVARLANRNSFKQTLYSMRAIEALALLHGITINKVLSGYELMIFSF